MKNDMKETEPSHSDKMATERTRMAAERTLMAWTRTALSLISFGFTIYKFMQTLQDQSRIPVLKPEAPRNVGLMLIGLGTAALIAATIQHWKYMKTIDPQRTYKVWDLAFVVAILLTLIGLLMFGSILLHAGPLG
jgi:putative membrane protein